MTLSTAVFSLPIVVVGAGIAGVTCVETLRQLNYAGPIVLISKEAELPYDRKSLSKVSDRMPMIRVIRWSFSISIDLAFPFSATM